MKTNLEELTWIARVVLARDEKAFERIVDKYQQTVRRFFWVQSGGDAALSDDLAQETFIKVWQHLSGFKQAAAFSTWLYSVAYRVWLDHCRGEKDNISLDDEQCSLQIEISPFVSPPEHADVAVEASDCREQIQQALARLSEHERVCITLFYLEELSIRDISRITHMNESLIKVCLHRGRQHLRLLLAHPFSPFNPAEK